MRAVPLAKRFRQAHTAGRSPMEERRHRQVPHRSTTIFCNNFLGALPLTATRGRRIENLCRLMQNPPETGCELRTLKSMRKKKHIYACIFQVRKICAFSPTKTYRTAENLHIYIYIEREDPWSFQRNTIFPPNKKIFTFFLRGTPFSHPTKRYSLFFSKEHHFRSQQKDIHFCFKSQDGQRIVFSHEDKTAIFVIQLAYSTFGPRYFDRFGWLNWPNGFLSLWPSNKKSLSGLVKYHRGISWKDWGYSIFMGFQIGEDLISYSSR